jgi:hypothetical protein
MPDREFDPQRFFDQFPRFVETSATGHVLERLNARYTALLHENRALIDGSRVLDLASHDGRFSFAALKTGATHVVGIEAEPTFVETAKANMDLYDVPSDSYDFVVGDMFEEIEMQEPCDVVFCFGILYHINDHMTLLTRIAETDPKTVIIDTNVARLDAALIELRNPMTGVPPNPGGQLEGYPSRSALDVMMSSFGWTYEYFDWEESDLSEREQMHDYRTRRRVSVVIDCHRQALSADERAQAVATVFEHQTDRRTQWGLIRRVAKDVGTTPQALCVWVRKAERAQRSPRR